MKDADDLLRDIDELLWGVDVPVPPRAEPPPEEEPEAPPPMIAPPAGRTHVGAGTDFASSPRVRRPVPEVKPRRLRTLGRRRRWRALRFLGVLAGAFAVGAVVSVVATMLGSDRIRTGGSGIVAAPPEQHVVAWTVWQREPPGPVFVSVLGSGGGKDPVALGIPTYTVVSIPGHGLGTVSDAARGGDDELVATTVENLLGVSVDASFATEAGELAALVDRAGGIHVRGREMDGGATVEYLMGGRIEVGELRFLRWQEVVAGLLAALEASPEALDGGVPEEARAALASVATAETEIVEFPVEDVGAGLASPQAQAVAALVAERFVDDRRTEGDVRLVVLNGNGIPGIGEDVARLLVPAGFRLVSSQNAPSFDVTVTRIVASTEEYLDEAELARELLGVGEVYLGEQPTGVTDVSVLVGHDFGGS